MKKLVDWTTVYDDGREVVRMIDDVDNGLYWSYSDCEGELECCHWKSTQEAAVIDSWLDEHSIDSSTFTQSRNTNAWEKLLSKYRNKTVGALVEGVRKSEQLAF